MFNSLELTTVTIIVTFLLNAKLNYNRSKFEEALKPEVRQGKVVFDTIRILLTDIEYTLYPFHI